MKYLRTVIVVVLARAAVAGTIVLKGLWDVSVDPPAGLPARTLFQPTQASLATHRLPTWFEDAKFGIRS